MTNELELRKLKILIVGEPDSGKKLIAKTANVCMPLKNLGVSIGKKSDSIELIKHGTSIILWTLTTGRPSETTYYQGAQAAIIVCNLKNKESVLKMKNWAESIIKNIGSVPIFFIGNKIEDANSEEISMMENIADSFKAPYFFLFKDDKKIIDELFSLIVSATE